MIHDTITFERNTINEFVHDNGERCWSCDDLFGACTSWHINANARLRTVVMRDTLRPMSLGESAASGRPALTSLVIFEEGLRQLASTYTLGRLRDVAQAVLQVVDGEAGDAVEYPRLQHTRSVTPPPWRKQAEEAAGCMATAAANAAKAVEAFGVALEPFRDMEFE
jgi:hypothetical protein